MMIEDIFCLSKVGLIFFQQKKKPCFLSIQYYFLGGRIDHGHHYSQAVRALDETVEFEKAIDLARKRTSEEDTLIVVTSDHSHTMSIAGYSVSCELIFFSSTCSNFIIGILFFI